MKKFYLLLLLLVATLTFVTACNVGTKPREELSASEGSSIEESNSSLDSEMQSASNEGSEDSEDSSSSGVEPGGEDSEDSSSSSADQGGKEPGGEDEYEIITVAKALELCGEPGNITTERYYIRVVVDSVLNANYGEMNVSDETGTIYVYGAYSADGSLSYAQMEDKPYKGDTVLLHCILQNYNGTKEVQNARIIEFEHAVVEDDGSYVQSTILSARSAEVGAKVQVSGVVAAITYANGLKPSGVILVDDTSSIYIYDANIAGRVSVGNQITVNASKTYWILESEQASAEKHGYKGCNQLENATLISNDNGSHEFNKEWIEENTVKAMLETPVSEDITTLIYKVTALIKKVPGNGFTNYYFNDLDGETGTYVYSQCNGNDYGWLDEFDGKICTAYLMNLNAKSSATACFFRFYPVAVEDNGFEFDLNNATKFAVDYHALDQFEAVYGADPAKEMNTEVSSELLGFEGVKLSYSSSNEEIVYFEESEGKVIMHCNKNGTATVTVSASFGEYEAYSTTVEVKMLNADAIESITVAEAIAVAPNNGEASKVTVKGIVGPSVVNKNGFYLFGEDGSVITVLVNDTAQFEGLEIGHMVILSGERERYVKDDSSAFAGQTCIVNAVIEVNLYGKHEYSTAKFVTGKTGAEFYNLDSTVDYSTTVFVLTVSIQVVESPYYTTMTLKASDGTTINLYNGSASQYSFLFPFAGEEITVEIAPCNWNDKNYWRGCVLAVVHSDGTKTYNTLNFDAY